VGDGIGVEELIQDAVKPLLLDRYSGQSITLRHIGDPAGQQREQSSSARSAVRAVKQALGGTWRSGPVKLDERLEPLRAALTRTVGGRGMVQVDRERAAAIWHALRGGWHYHVARSGLVSGIPVKDIHSHPGDALAYGAAVLFPMGRLLKKGTPLIDKGAGSSYFPGGPREAGAIGRPPPKGFEMPQHGAKL
jgi:hypothetical protein